MNKPLITPTLSAPRKKSLSRLFRELFLKVKKSCATLPIVSNKRITLLLGFCLMLSLCLVIYYVFFMSWEDEGSDEESDDIVGLSEAEQNKFAALGKERQRQRQEQQQSDYQAAQEIDAAGNQQNDKKSSGSDVDSDVDVPNDDDGGDGGDGGDGQKAEGGQDQQQRERHDEQELKDQDREDKEGSGRDASQQDIPGSAPKDNQSKREKSLKKRRRREKRAREKIKEHWDKIKQSYRRVQERDSELRENMYRSKTDAESKFDEQFQRIESM